MVQEPLGILEQMYKRGSTPNDQRCTWYLKAPANHVVNIISVLFVMEDEATDASVTDYVSSSTISLYDGDMPKENRLLTRCVLFFLFSDFERKRMDCDRRVLVCYTSSRSFIIHQFTFFLAFGKPGN